MDKSLWKYIHVGVIKHREYSFHVKYIFIGNWNAKVGSQETPGLTGKFGLGVQNETAKANRVLPRERTGHSKHPLPAAQEKTLHMGIIRWSIPKSD